MDNDEVLRAWEERIIFPEKGSRIFHYILRDTTGSSLLAAVGIQRSIRHMVYAISQDFLNVFGSTSTANAETRWRARRDLVQWLTSVTSEKRPIFADPSQKVIETKPSLENLMSMMTRFSNRLSTPAWEIQGSGDSVVQTSEIVWSGDARICTKHLKHYPAFYRSGTTIPICSFVFIKSEKETDYIGYVEDLYEDQKGEKLVRVRWFHFCKEMENRIPNLDAHSNEVFITCNERVISAESIDGVAAVLTPEQFEKCLSFLPRDLSFVSFRCHREYREKKIRPFRLSELRGYSTQPILSSLVCHLSQQRNNKEKSTEKLEGSAPQEPEGLSLKAPECGNYGPTAVANNQEAIIELNHHQLKIKLPSKEPTGIKCAAPKPRCQLFFKVNENVEVLSQDSGLRGCWFRCKILYCSQKFLKVQHYDVLDVDGPGKLEERVPSSKVANSDKLGMRCAGRLTVRPWPSKDVSDFTCDIGSAVDAWWCDGWWEGVVIGCHPLKESQFQVYFPGENKFMTVERKNLRLSRDWVDNKWIDIKAKPDLLSFLTSTFNPAPKLPPVPIFSEANTSSARGKGKVHQPVTAERSGDANKRHLPNLLKSAEEKSLEELNFKKRLLIRNNEEEAARSSGNANSNRKC